jgi:hypothetical protein
MALSSDSRLEREGDNEQKNKEDYNDGNERRGEWGMVAPACGYVDRFARI